MDQRIMWWWRRIPTIALASCMFAIGCGDGADEDTAAGGSKGAGAGSTTGPSTGPGPSGSGDAATSGAGASGGGDTGKTVTLTMTEFTVPSGGEVFKCQNFANPFGGDAEVTKFESHMTAGSHHLLLFYKDGVGDAPLEECSGLEFAATPYGSQVPDDSVSYPDGVAALVKATTGFRLQTHYLNTTPAELTAKVTVTFHLAEPGTVTAHAGVLFVVEPNIFVAPGQTQVVKHDCSLPFDMNLIKATSHMHKHATHFTSSIAGAKVFETAQWADPVPAVFEPPRSVSGGAPVHFECTFTNTGTIPLTFGESATNNEMCIFIASFYPVPSDDSVTVGCD